MLMKGEEKKPPQGAKQRRRQRKNAKDGQKPPKGLAQGAVTPMGAEGRGSLLRKGMKLHLIASLDLRVRQPPSAIQNSAAEGTLG